MKALYYKLRKNLFINRITHFIPGMVKPFVLSYHQFDAAEFEAQIKALQKRNFEIVDLKEFVSRLQQKKSGGYCTITIDDCLTEDIGIAAPICRKYNIPVTLFLPIRFSKNNEVLPSSWIQKLFLKRDKFVLNGEEYTLTPENRRKIKTKVNRYFDPVRLRTDDFLAELRKWFKENNLEEGEILTEEYRVMPVDEVKKLSQDNLFSYQSHTYNHQSLSLCTTEEIEYEFSQSKKELEEITGKEVYSICYPYGSKEIIGDKIFGIVDKYYTCGFSLVQGVCNKNTDIFFIPRIGIYPGDKLTKFWGKIYHHMQMEWVRKVV